MSAASAAQPQALSTWTSATSALSAASSAQSHASSALAPSVGSSHTGSAQHGPGKAQKSQPAVLTKVEERVKLVPMLHPDQRQHKEARLQVWHTCEFCVKHMSEIHRVRLAGYVHPKLVTYSGWTYRARDTQNACGFCASLTCDTLHSTLFSSLTQLFR